MLPLSGLPEPRRERPRLRVINGGLARQRTAEEWFERGLRELAASCKRVNNASGYPSRAVADMAQAIRCAFAGRITRLIAGVLEGGGPIEFGERLGHLIITYNAQKARALGLPAQSPHDDDEEAA